MYWSLRTFRIKMIYLIGSLLCCIQLVKADGQNETHSSKSFKRSFDFPPIFYPGPDNKFITVAPPPKLPDNLMVFVNNLGSPEITTFRPPLTSNDDQPTPPAQKPHQPSKSRTKPFRTSTPFPSKHVQQNFNSIRTPKFHNFPTTPTPSIRASDPPHFRPANPSSSTAKPLRKKLFRDHLQPTTFRPNNGQRFSTPAKPFQDFRQNFHNERPDHILEHFQERPKPPKPHRFQGDLRQRPVPSDRPEFNSFDSKRQKNGSPPKHFQPIPPQTSSVAPVYVSNNNQKHFSSTNRPFTSPQEGQFGHSSKQIRPHNLNPFSSPPPRMKTSSQSPFPKGHQGRPVFPRPSSLFPENMNDENRFKLKPQPSWTNDWENGFPRYKEQDNKLNNNKTPMKSSAASFYPHNNEERRTPVLSTNEHHGHKFSKTRLNKLNDGRGFQSFSPFSHRNANSRFSCKFLEPGYYADINTGCETFHVCHQRQQYTFSCPRGTRFSQQYLICDWAHRVICSPFSDSQNSKDFV